MSNRMVNAAVAGLAIMASLTAVAPAQADSLRSTSCVGAGGSFSCVSVRRGSVPNPHIIPVQPTTEEIAAAEQRERQWVARCRPSLRQDNYGVSHYVYAAPGCEFGKTE